MANLNKQEIVDWLGANNQGYFVTVNSLSKDRIYFEQDLGRLSHRLNDFCLGRSYKRKESRLRVLAGIETGQSSKLFHAHLVITADKVIHRTFKEINAYTRKQWYSLIGLNNPYGSMVDVQPVGDLYGRVDYIAKDFHYWMRNGEHCLSMF